MLIIRQRIKVENQINLHDNLMRQNRKCFMLKSLFFISSKLWQDIIVVLQRLKNSQKVSDFIYIIVINNQSRDINYELQRGFRLVGQGETQLEKRLKHL